MRSRAAPRPGPAAARRPATTSTSSCDPPMRNVRSKPWRTPASELRRRRSPGCTGLLEGPGAWHQDAATRDAARCLAPGDLRRAPGSRGSAPARYRAHSPRAERAKRAELRNTNVMPAEPAKPQRSGPTLKKGAHGGNMVSPMRAERATARGAVKSRTASRRSTSCRPGRRSCEGRGSRRRGGSGASGRGRATRTGR
jgi:hypothetical protein